MPTFAKHWKVTSESTFMAGSELPLKCTNPCSAGCNAHYRHLIFYVALIYGTSFWPPFMVYISVMFWVDAVWLYLIESHSYISPNWWIFLYSNLANTFQTSAALVVALDCQSLNFSIIQTYLLKYLNFKSYLNLYDPLYGYYTVL